MKWAMYTARGFDTNNTVLVMREHIPSREALKDFKCEQTMKYPAIVRWRVFNEFSHRVLQGEASKPPSQKALETWLQEQTKTSSRQQEKPRRDRFGAIL